MVHRSGDPEIDAIRAELARVMQYRVALDERIEHLNRRARKVWIVAAILLLAVYVVLPATVLALKLAVH